MHSSRRSFLQALLALPVLAWLRPQPELPVQTFPGITDDNAWWLEAHKPREVVLIERPLPPEAESLDSLFYRRWAEVQMELVDTQIANHPLLRGR